MDTSYKDFLETKRSFNLPDGHHVQDLSSRLFNFQRDIVHWAILLGRAAIFADCGLGKTIMQLTWANEVVKYTKRSVIILAPLAVSDQTKREGEKFDIPVYLYGEDSMNEIGIYITNYERLHRVDISQFAGVVLDESSILKSYTGTYRTTLIKSFQHTHYRLACTATPSPNDFTELGNHAEFLGVTSRTEMLSMFFINDSGDTGTWRLKHHASEKFWEWVCSWAVMIQRPSDLGYDDGFQLPQLHIHDRVLKADAPIDGSLFIREAKTLSERRQARRSSLKTRCQVAAELTNKHPGQWLIWCDLNDESEELSRLIHGAVQVQGSDSEEHKVSSMMGFAAGNIRVLVTKPRIAGFGMNWQGCHQMAFVGLSDSYESYYQAVRRCWRFGQSHDVHAYIITSELEGDVVSNIQRKERDAQRMAKEMTKNMKDISSANIHGHTQPTHEYSTSITEGNGWTLHLGDAVEVIKTLEDNSIGYSIFSPPFASLFTYSDSARDMGNSRNSEEFFIHFQYLIHDLFRVLMAGRLLSFHCMNLPSTITHDGVIGMKDFRGDLIRAFQNVGFIYHSEVCIWKDPLVQATRTKTLTLAHKQISKDSAMCGQGFPDYIVTMRKPGPNPEPIAHGRGFERYAGSMEEPLAAKTNDARTNKYSHHVWQRYASPVWFDIRQTVTLNSVKGDRDEKHVCPLQLDTIDRCLDLWSNPGDTVLSPFAGIGSEGYQAIKMGRKFIGIELKPEYFEQAVKNLYLAESHKYQQDLFVAETSSL